MTHCYDKQLYPIKASAGSWTEVGCLGVNDNKNNNNDNNHNNDDDDDDDDDDDNNHYKFLKYWLHCS